MQLDQTHQLMSDLLWTGLLLCSPVLLIAMVVGLLTNILQVVTQIQDMSLSFIPKILASVIALVFFGPWMLKTLLNYASHLIGGISKFL